MRRTRRASIRPPVLAAGILAASLVVGSCKGSEPSSPLFRGTTVAITGAPTDGVLLLDNSVQLRAEVKSAEGAVVPDVPVTWRSSDDDRASVSADGVVRGIRMGDVVVSALAGGATDTRSMSVRVGVPKPASRSGTPVTTTMLDGVLRMTVPGDAIPVGSVLHARLAAAPPANERLVRTSAVDLGPEELRFDRAVTLSLAFPADVPSSERAYLRIHRVSDGAWVAVSGNSVDIVEGRVRVNILRAGTYAILRRAPAASIAMGAGDGQQGGLGGVLPDAPRVIARDESATPVEGAVVRYTVLSGGGSIVGADSGVSDATGTASLIGQWRLGSVAGTNTLRASLVGVQSAAVTFTATATAAPRIVLSQPELNFDAIVGANPPAREVQVTAGAGTISALALGAITYPAGNATGWLQASLDRTITPAVLRLTVGSSSLAPSDYVARVPVRSGTTGVVPDTLVVRLAVRHGVTTALVVTRQLGGAMSGHTATTQPLVEFRTASGALSPVNQTVRAEILSGAGTLRGTTTVTAVNGVATFTDLRVDGWGANRLRFVSGSVAVDGSSFTVSQVLAALEITVQPSGAREDKVFMTQPVLKLTDEAGLPYMAGKTVTASRETGPGSLEGNTSIVSVDGFARFSNLKIDDGTGAHTLRFRTSTPTLSVVSGSFTVVP